MASVRSRKPERTLVPGVYPSEWIYMCKRKSLNDPPWCNTVLCSVTAVLRVLRDKSSANCSMIIFTANIKFMLFSVHVHSREQSVASDQDQINKSLVHKKQGNVCQRLFSLAQLQIWAFFSSDKTELSKTLVSRLRLRLGWSQSRSQALRPSL